MQGVGKRPKLFNRGSSLECVRNGDASGLYQFTELDMLHFYVDGATDTRATLLGCAMIRDDYPCMLALLLLGANPHATCLTCRVKFLSVTNTVRLSAIAFNERNLSRLSFALKREAQLRVTQWCVNQTGCGVWRDLVIELLQRLKEADF